MLAVMTVPRYGAKTLWRPVSSSAAIGPDSLGPGLVFKGTAKARRNVVSLVRQNQNQGERGIAAHRPISSLPRYCVLCVCVCVRVQMCMCVCVLVIH